MKKFFILQTFFFSILSLSAQITVNSSGLMGINTNPNSIYGINASYPSKIAGIYQIHQGYSSQGVTGIYSKTIHSSGAGSSAGVKAFAKADSPQNSGYCYGVFSGAGNGKDGYNYGIFSVLYNSTKGAAIYGTTDSSLSQQYMDTRYAGYFNGQVKVQGNLTVTGNVTGLLLSPTSPTGTAYSSTPQSISKKSLSDCSVTSQLLGLSVNSFYHEGAKTRESSNKMDTSLSTEANNDTVCPIVSDSAIADSILVAISISETEPQPEPTLTKMEQQVLDKQHYEISADELEEAFPDLVYENEDGTKSINYVEMVPILVQAINELSAKVEELEGGSDAKKAATRGTTSLDGMDESLIMLSLGQNKPNPFGTTTSIDVSIPESVQKAFIYVYDLQGKKVEQVDIAARGKQSVQLNAATLSDGMYLYSLIADGKVVETRRMIVEK